MKTEVEVFFGLLRRAVWWLDINVSEDHSASIFSYRLRGGTGTGFVAAYSPADTCSHGIEPCMGSWPHLIHSSETLEECPYYYALPEGKLIQVQVRITLQLTVGQSVSQSVHLGVGPLVGLMNIFILYSGHW